MVDKLLNAFLAAKDPTQTMAEQLGEMIKLRASQQTKKAVRRRLPLKLLLAGYAGAGNTGSDVRTYEMIRQFKHIFGKNNVELTLQIMSEKFAGRMFSSVTTRVPGYMPTFLFKEIAKQHGVIACEGSLFKSNFSTVLALNMLGALGLAVAENKIAIAYGAEAGRMDKLTRDFTQQYCQSSLAICRNPQSQKILKPLGIRSALGADPAWTFTPRKVVDVNDLLRQSGWDGKKKIIAICPNNPFWWPVTPDPARAQKQKTNSQDQYHRSVFFHHFNSEVAAKQKKFIENLACVVRTLRQKHRLFPIIVGMERVDRGACDQLAKLLSFAPPVFASDQWNPHAIVSLLRSSHYVIALRYHALVTAMPGGVIPFGIAMDERVKNLFSELGHAELCVGINDEAFAEKILQQFANLNETILHSNVTRMTAMQLKRLGQMGMSVQTEVQQVYPHLHLPLNSDNWRTYLPKMHAAQRAIVDSY